MHPRAVVPILVDCGNTSAGLSGARSAATPFAETTETGQRMLFKFWELRT